MSPVVSTEPVEKAEEIIQKKKITPIKRFNPFRNRIFEDKGNKTPEDERKIFEDFDCTANGEVEEDEDSLQQCLLNDLRANNLI
jgi:hypothetical protein